jgi:hypothetical protein
MMSVMFVIGFAVGAGAMFAMHMIVWQQLESKRGD